MLGILITWCRLKRVYN